MTKILIVGLGKIGFYHFQSLFNSKSNFSIDCVEISDQRIEILQNYLKKFKNKKKINILKSFKMIDKNYDFLIHSTSSDVRLVTLRKILKISKIKYAILEKNLTGNLIELKHFKKIEKNFKKCCVNTFRHETSLWKNLEMKSKLRI